MPDLTEQFASMILQSSPPLYSHLKTSVLFLDFLYSLLLHFWSQSYQICLLIFLLPFLSCIFQRHWCSTFNFKHLLYGIPLLLRGKKEDNLYNQEPFYSAIKKKSLKNTQRSTIRFCYYFSVLPLCALMLWSSKHLPWLLYIFYMFFYFSDTLFFFHFFLFASIMFFDLFLNGRTIGCAFSLVENVCILQRKHRVGLPIFFKKEKRMSKENALTGWDKCL